MRLHQPELPATPGSSAAPGVQLQFGVPVADPYRWLEDESDPRVQEFVTAQDEQARQRLGALPGRELRALIHAGDGFFRASQIVQNHAAQGVRLGKVRL